MSKRKIRDLNPFKRLGSLEYEEYKALLMNAVTIEGLDASIERFVKNALIESNRVGYDALTNRWAVAYGEGLNEYWNPEYITFVFPNKTSYQRRAYYKPASEGAYLIRALPTAISFAEIIEKTTDELTECDISIRQNLIAVRTPFVAVCDNPDNRLSLEQAISQKEDGKPAIIVSNKLREAVGSIDFNTPYYVDKIEQYRQIIRDRLLNKLGIMSANINKRERVQVGEVNATVGQCVDYIYLWIDTFNKQMTEYGLPFNMRLNGALEELYTDSTEQEDVENDKQRNDTVTI